MNKNMLFTRLILPVFTLGLIMSQPAIADDDKKDTPLGKSMEEASDALKSLRKIDKNDWAAGAEAARKAADGIRKGMEYIPALVKDMKDGKEKTKAIADYRRLLGLSYADLCELELAYLEEDQGKVDAAMKKIKATKKEGHKKYEDD
ncbi:MAG: hypothetical protein H7A51_08380 [Akkermansiaceae bacterium]|nr:hypothetical protein [Akkermansiaceae bacterium]